MHWRSITFRLVAPYCGLLLLLGASFSLFTIVSFERYTSATFQTNLAARAADVWRIVQPILDNPAQVAPQVEQRFNPSAQDRFIRISRDGRVIYRSDAPDDASFDPATIPLPTIGTQTQTRTYGRLVLYTQKFQATGGGAVIVESGQSDVFAKGMEVSLVSSLVIGLPILLFLAAAGGYVLIQRALAPVETMIKAAEVISFNDPSTRLPLMGSGDRVEALGLALNRMLDRLDTAYQHANRFSFDAAHELRTPLAIIQGELESAVLGQGLPTESESALANVLDELNRLSNIVDSLLKLSRMDRPGQRVAVSVDLFELAGETVEQMQLLAAEQQVLLKGPTGARAFVHGDRDRLKQVLVNLLDNGIKYNVPGGHVAVDVTAVGDTARICVSDSGIGIAPENQNFIFDRFYRVSTNRGETGAGLGLAIVKSICQAHGGKIEVASSVGAGTIFVITLPLGAVAAKSATDTPTTATTHPNRELASA